MDPVIFEIGWFKLQYYGLMYIVGFAISYSLVLLRIKREKRFHVSVDQIQDIMLFMILGLIVGARLGYVLFYNLSYYLRHPLEILLPFEFSNGITFTGIAGNTLYFEGTGGGAGDILLQGGTAPSSDVTVTIPPTTGTILLSNLTSSHIFVGDAGVATDVAMSGDVHIDSTGLTTIQPDSVALTTDTDGVYVGDVAGENAITVTGTAGEGYTETVKLGGPLTEATTITQGD